MSHFTLTDPRCGGVITKQIIKWFIAESASEILSIGE